MQILNALTDGIVLLDLHAQDLDEIFRRALDAIVDRGLLAREDREQVLGRLRDREERVSTAIGHSVAVPHAYLECFTQQVVVFVRLARPLNLGAPDGIPTRFLFILLGPKGTAAEHLDTLTGVARLMSDDEFRYEAGRVEDHQDLLDAIVRFQARTAPPLARAAAEVPEGLRYTGRLFGGLIGDIKRRLPHYVSDFRDGLHPKCLASTLFLFFACLAPAVTFGGILAELVDNRIGPVEMLACTAVCGVTFSLLGGQPLIILGMTGPILVFDVILYELCGDLQFQEHYLSARVWVGLWTGLIVLVLAATDASCLMRFFTRFTDEIFAALIAVIFIYEALRGVAAQFEDLEVHQHHDTALLSLLLALGTFYIAMSLSRFRRSRYLNHNTREFLADFGPTIALAAMTVVAILLRGIDLPMLPAPETFRPSHEQDGPPRAWLIDPFQAPTWVWFGSALPALLLAVLVFADQNITARLVNSRDHKLQKGEAYHLDLAVVGVLVALCPLVGFPWMVAATVRSLNHVRSLATVEEVANRAGEKRERVIHVRETRVTALSIHLLVGISLFFLTYLAMIPMAVLYGLFLFMGVVSIGGNQFFQRLSLWITDRTLYPATHYIRRVPLRTIHAFTAVQLFGLVVLWAVKESDWGIVFPLFIVLLVPLRFALDRWFAPEHLAALDAEEEPEEEQSTWM